MVHQMNAAPVAQCRLASFGDSLGHGEWLKAVECGRYMEPRVRSRYFFYMANGFIAMPPNPALKRTGRYVPSTWRASARPAG